MDIRIIVATHKKYRMPEDDIYLPLYVGADTASDDADLHELSYAKDNSGDNISSKNKNYCELTGLYWAWKNLHADYIGLVHYRRHFTVKKFIRRLAYDIRNGRKDYDKFDYVLSGEELSELLEKHDVILPYKRRYFIETGFSQYAHAHHAIDLETTREVIADLCPKYLTAFDNSLGRTSVHLFNMFIMKKDLFDAYCEWLFEILFELENRLDISDYNTNDARVFGFVAERLLDPWIETNGVEYKELPYVFMEKQNWIIKGGSFIKRKMKRK